MPDEIKVKTPTQEQAEKAQKELNEVLEAKGKPPVENLDEMLKPQTVVKIFARTRYVYEVVEKASLRMIFEMSFYESDPEKVLEKANRILVSNVGNPKAYGLRIKYLEVLE